MKKTPAEILDFEVVDGGLIFTVACAQLDDLLYFRCPFCGELHQHGAGDGHRVAHCHFRGFLNKKGYYLKAVDDWKKAGALKAALADRLLRRDRKKHLSSSREPL